MKKYEIIDISGDVGLRVYGENVGDVFINAAIGMYSLITDFNSIKEEKTIDVTIEGPSLESLFVSWLNELIFYFDTYGFIGKRIVINQREGMGVLKASISGEDFDPKRHESRLLIKAATYNKLRIEKIDDRWEAEVIFDI